MSRIMTKYFQVVVLSSLLLAYHIQAAATSCPLEEDITNIARCIQVDVTAIIYAVRGQEDLTSFCQLADRYMECFKTYTRGCVGFHFAEGTLTELQNIALYCCQGIYKNPDCPLNTNVRKCFAQDSYVTLADGSHKSLNQVEVGDKVKTLDSNGNLVNTDVIMIMDKSQEESLFMTIKTHSNKTLSLSGSHLLPVPDGTYKYAKKLYRNDEIITFDAVKQASVVEKIKSILVEPIQGYVAPLTMSGTILVNDILASCYAVINSHSVAHTVMSPARWWYSMTYGHSRSEHQEVNGTHWYPQMLMKFSDILLSKLVYLD